MRATLKVTVWLLGGWCMGADERHVRDQLHLACGLVGHRTHPFKEYRFQKIRSRFLLVAVVHSRAANPNHTPNAKA